MPQRRQRTTTDNEPDAQMKTIDTNPRMPLRAGARPVLLPSELPREPIHSLVEPGTAVMTDLDRAAAVTVDADTRIDDALPLMRDAGVRSAFVIDAGCNLLGLVTAYDILGDKPVRHLESRGCTLRTCRREDVTVGDIMETTERWMVIDVTDLASCRVGDVVETFRRTGRTHIPVVERTSLGADRLRGLLSAAEVARATGIDTSGLRAAESFAEIEQAVTRGVLP
jgi:CBS domain-containing protein